jgi:hypothetical protein
MAKNRTWLAVDPGVHKKLQFLSMFTGYTIRELTDEIISRFAGVVHVQKLVERRKHGGPISPSEERTLQQFAPLVAMMAALCDALDPDQSKARRFDCLVMLELLDEAMRNIAEPRARSKR